jgi:hypothetical protein
MSVTNGSDGLIGVSSIGHWAICALQYGKGLAKVNSILFAAPLRASPLSSRLEP